MMGLRRSALLLLFVLGAWSCGTVFMWQTAIQNFVVAERVAAVPNDGLAAVVEGLAPDRLRDAVRFQASEVNRLFFVGWGWVQLPLALAALGLAWSAGAGRWSLGMLGAMLAIVALLAVYVVPETVRLGRMIDFVPDGSLPDVEDTFWLLHHSYTAADMLKFVLGLAVAAIAVRACSAGLGGSSGRSA